jgi:hypothetical protein
MILFFFRPVFAFFWRTLSKQTFFGSFCTCRDRSISRHNAKGLLSTSQVAQCREGRRYQSHVQEHSQSRLARVSKIHSTQMYSNVDLNFLAHETWTLHVFYACMHTRARKHTFTHKSEHYIRVNEQLLPALDVRTRNCAHQARQPSPTQTSQS